MNLWDIKWKEENLLNKPALRVLLQHQDLYFPPQLKIKKK